MCVTEQHQIPEGPHPEGVGHARVLPAHPHLRGDAIPAADVGHHSHSGLHAVHLIHKQSSSGSRVGDAKDPFWILQLLFGSSTELLCIYYLYTALTHRRFGSAGPTYTLITEGGTKTA